MAFCWGRRLWRKEKRRHGTAESNGSNIFNTNSCCAALNSFPQILREFLPPTFGKYAPVVPRPGVRGLTTFATWLPICFEVFGNDNIRLI
jgi:hypothetical protein